jgi:HEAT repeat protein
MKRRLLLAMALTALCALASAQSAAEVRQLIAQLKDKDISRRREALLELMSFGPKAKEAVPALIEVFGSDDAELRQVAVNVLDKIGKTAVPDLEKALQSDTPLVRRQACLALGKIGPPAQSALPALGKLVAQDKDKEVRGFAVSALGKIDAEAKTSLPLLRGALKDDDKGVRLTAVATLGQASDKVDAAIPVLAEGLADKEAAVRFLTLSSLQTLDDKAKKAVPAMVAALKDKDPGFRTIVAEVLVRLDKSQAAAISQAMIVCLQDQEAPVRRKACDVLGALGPAATKEARTALAGVSKDDAIGDVRRAAAAALEKTKAKE